MQPIDYFRISPNTVCLFATQILYMVLFSKNTVLPGEFGNNS